MRIVVKKVRRGGGLLIKFREKIVIFQALTDGRRRRVAGGGRLWRNLLILRHFRYAFAG
jgi:hypothetical protein